MAFFSPGKLKPRKIEVDQSAISCDSPEVQKRLDRIESNYEQLDTILANLEAKMASDERLKAIDESSAADFEQTFGVKRKRKWKPAKKSRTRKRRSAGPNKPR